MSMKKIIVEMSEMQKLAGVPLEEATSKGEIERVVEAMFKAPKAKAFLDKLEKPGIDSALKEAVQNIIMRILEDKGIRVGGSAEAKKAVKQLARG